MLNVPFLLLESITSDATSISVPVPNWSLKGFGLLCGWGSKFSGAVQHFTFLTLDVVYCNLPPENPHQERHINLLESLLRNAISFSRFHAWLAKFRGRTYITLVVQNRLFSGKGSPWRGNQVWTSWSLFVFEKRENCPLVSSNVHQSSSLRLERVNDQFPSSTDLVSMKYQHESVCSGVFRFFRDTTSPRECKRKCQKSLQQPQCKRSLLCWCFLHPKDQGHHLWSRVWG